MQHLQRLSLLIPLLLFFISPSATHAMTLPSILHHDGLIIEQPLLLSGSTSSIKQVKLVFGSTEKIVVSKSNDEQVLAEKIVSPTPKKIAVATPVPTLPADIVDTPEKEKKPTATPQPKIEQHVNEPTPTSTPPPVPTSASLPAYATNGTLNADVLFSMANQKRSEAGLPAFEKHPEVCAIAESRKPEIENEIYGNSSIHAGFRARNLPFRASENMISRGSEAEAFNWWMNSSIHRAGILGESKYACVACQNKTCAMIFSSLEPR